MISSVFWLARQAARAARDQSGANSVEYVLTIGTVVILFVVALIAAADILFPAMAGLMCPAIDTGDPNVGRGTCLAP